MSWDEPHNSFAQKRFVETGGGGALGGEKLRAVLPTELHTLDAALTLSGWGERPREAGRHVARWVGDARERDVAH